jgi:hypothetical protein
MKYRTSKDSKPIPVLLDKPLRDRIAALSERLGEGKSVVMRIAMRVGLDSLEKAFEGNPPNLSSLVYRLKPDEGVLVEERAQVRKKKAG